jgi:hypothetical protein
MDRDVNWPIIAVAKPSSSPRSVPLLDAAYWKGVFSAAPTNTLCLDWKAPRKDTGTQDPNLLVDTPSILTLKSYIGPGGTCAAFRGTWHGVPIVVKYSLNKYSTPFAREAQAYLGGLAHLRGTVVPEFFGIYRSDFFALLVFEDCGDKISKWDDLNLQERYVHDIFVPCDCRSLLI